MANEIANVTAVTEDEVQIAGAFPQIIVSGTVEKPFFEIVYLDLKDGDIHVGFGSYDLAYVFQWLKEYFGETRAKIIDPETLRSKGRWNVDVANLKATCSECGTVLSFTDEMQIPLLRDLDRFCYYCGADMRGESDAD